MFVPVLILWATYAVMIMLTVVWLIKTDGDNTMGMVYKRTAKGKRNLY